MKKIIVMVVLSAVMGSSYAAMPTAADCKRAHAKCPSHPGNTRCAKVLPKCAKQGM
ncbi:MAG: hypothetical protein NTU49_04990 [Gammaproteobacteria bacterium]|nr:hypothetical protein [Gammaproteobacteria bacterium]